MKFLDLNANKKEQLRHLNNKYQFNYKVYK